LKFFSETFEISAAPEVVVTEPVKELTVVIGPSQGIVPEVQEIAPIEAEEIVECLVPEMKKVATIEHDDIVDDSDNVSVVSSVDSVNVSDHEEFPCMSESESGFELEQDSNLITRNLPTYETKVRMTVRSDCTKDSPVIHTLDQKTRVYLLETGIENFPTGRLCYWWRKTFAGQNMNSVCDYIRLHNMRGAELAEFSAATRMKLSLEMDEHEIVRKALKLVKRKAQVVFFDEYGIARRGWISKVKKGKQTISRIFMKSTPTVCVRKMDNYGREIADVEESMQTTLESYGLEYDTIKFGTRFDEFQHGPEYVIRKGRRRHGKWRPENHCLIEFESYQAAAVAVKELSRSSELCHCEVDFAREYANLTTVTFPKL